MAKIRPGRLYKTIKGQSYTRREYMGGVPGSRIVQFDVGAISTPFVVKASLLSDRKVAIVHNALESARIAANRVLVKECGAAGYHLKIRVFPHEVVRENKQASGAGADRVSQGMRRAFGKAVGTAARVVPGQAIMTARVQPERAYAILEAFRKANMKLPMKTRVVFETGEKEARAVLATGKRLAAVGGVIKEEKPEGEAAPAEGEAAPVEGAAAPAAAGPGEKKGGKLGEKGGAPAKGAAPAKGGAPAKGEAKPAEKKDEKKGGKK
ncbi:MAG TPA: 50S ribosomal protein L16 [Candidatus Thermoplasmatota archaeon]|nr:50S ribosomal protein L16 [Candidatus Thermoplasmatota archaeon]